jgi:hypothetical protein
MPARRGCSTKLKPERKKGRKKGDEKDRHVGLLQTEGELAIAAARLGLARWQLVPNIDESPVTMARL